LPFFANNAEKRTYDPEQGIELFTNGGSSSSRHFILRGPGFDLQFSGHTASHPNEGVDQDLHAAISKTLIWKVYNLPLPLPGRSMEETREIITEALTAFKGVHGYPSGQAVAVRFLSTFDGEL
jgi:hypothetical protein